MSVTAAALRKLAMLNLSAEQMAGVLDILADGAELEETRRAGQRERTRKHRAQRDGNVTVTSLERDTVSPKKETSPTPPKEKTTPSISPSVVRAQFEELWTVFPNKVGKRDAEKAFLPALQRASFETILSGAQRYAAKTDDRPWCNPSTFLNQDRWADQPADLVQRCSAPQQRSTAPPARQAHNEILDAIIRGETSVPASSPTIDASYERSDGGSAASPVRLYALPSGRR